MEKEKFEPPLAVASEPEPPRGVGVEQLYTVSKNKTGSWL